MEEADRAQPQAPPDQDGVEGAITELISKHLGIS